MYKSHRGGSAVSPVLFSLEDSMEQSLVKALVSLMTAYDPEERPSTEEVLTKLESIAG